MILRAAKGDHCSSHSTIRLGLEFMTFGQFMVCTTRSARTPLLSTTTYDNISPCTDSTRCEHALPILVSRTSTVILAESRQDMAQLLSTAARSRAAVIMAVSSWNPVRDREVDEKLRRVNTCWEERRIYSPSPTLSMI